MRLRISSRQSDLARIQAYLVGAALRDAHPGLETGFRFRESLGDLNQTDPLWKMPERGVFTEDFLTDLVEGETDLVVHSWKDLPVADRAETEVVATLPRADARDVLLLKKSAWSRVVASRKLRVYSSSPRRARNLGNFMQTFLPTKISGVEFVPVRGNIPTRVRKLFEDGEVDALIVAKAAIDRLLTPVEGAPPDEAEKFASTAFSLRRRIEEVRWMVLPLSENPTAAAQGALAIEIRKDRADLRTLLAKIHCKETARTVRREREVLASYGGGCHQKIGVTILSRPYGEITFLRGETDQGEILDSESLSDWNNLDAENEFEASTAWPLPADSKSGYGEGFYERRPIAMKENDFWNHAEGRALWVARANALPESFTIDADTVVWTAGVATWKKLAERGIWVNGSAEGLGESESPRIDTLFGQVALWLSLTHSPVPGLRERDSGMPKLATYDLVARAELPDLRQKKELYWMSGSAFIAALARYPEIRNARHASGPGRTHEALREALGDDAKITIELNYSAWLKRVKGL